MTDQTDIPPIPVVDETNPDHASVEYSRYRTGLSHRRTGMSTARTDMSTHRTEMSSRRTGMSFQRTRMSADRTLMSVIRTSLSMIGFGFTIYQGFRGLIQAGVMQEGAARAASFFGQALVYLGVGMVAVGILYHLQFMIGLRRTRTSMMMSGDVHGESVFPVSLTLVVALLLLLLGVAAIVGIVFHLGPFG